MGPTSGRAGVEPGPVEGLADLRNISGPGLAENLIWERLGGVSWGNWEGEGEGSVLDGAIVAAELVREIIEADLDFFFG